MKLCHCHQRLRREEIGQVDGWPIQARCWLEWASVAGVRNKQRAAVITTEGNKMTLPVAMKTCQSPWHKANLVDWIGGVCDE